MRALLLILVAASMVVACDPANGRPPASATSTFAPAAYTAVPTTALATPTPYAVDLASRADLVRQLRTALAERDEEALRKTLTPGLLWGPWERNQEVSYYLVDHENLSRMLAPPAPVPLAIVQATAGVGYATGVLLDGWGSRALLFDERNANGPPVSDPKLRPVTLKGDRVVLVFDKEGHPLSQSGLFFGLSPADGWVKIAELPSVGAAPRSTPLALPIRGWDAPPPTGIAHIDAIVAAITRSDAAALALFITGRLVPCDPSRVVCPPGVSVGTLIRVVSAGACDAVDYPLVQSPDGRPRTTTAAAFARDMLSDENRLERVVGAWKSRPGTPEADRYRFALVAVHGDGVALIWIDDQGVTARWGGPCGETAAALLDRLSLTHDVVLAPPR